MIPAPHKSQASSGQSDWTARLFLRRAPPTPAHVAFPTDAPRSRAVPSRRTRTGVPHQPSHISLCTVYPVNALPFPITAARSAPWTASPPRRSSALSGRKSQLPAQKLREISVSPLTAPAFFIIIERLSGCGEVWYRAWFGTKRPRVQVPPLRPNPVEIFRFQPDFSAYSELFPMGNFVTFPSDPNPTQTGIRSGKHRKLENAACRSFSGRRRALFCSFLALTRHLP